MASGPDFTIQDRSFPIDFSVSGRYAVAGPCEKGPFGKFVDINNKTDFKRIFGGPIPESNFYHYCVANLERGCKLRVVRIAHATDPNDIATLAATYASYDVNDDAGSAATPARFVSSAYDPDDGGWIIDNGKTFTIDVDGTAETTKTVSVTAAQVTSVNNESAWDFTGGKSLQYRVNRGAVQELAIPALAFSNPAAPTAAELLAVLNGVGGLNGADAEAVGTPGTQTIRISTERKGTAAYVEIVGGDANAELAFPTAEQAGSGDFANHLSVQPAELKAFLEGANHLGAGGTDSYEIQLEGTDKIAIETTATGAGVHVGFDAPSTGASIIGGTEGAGGDVTGAVAGTPLPTLRGKGSSQGPWAAGLQFTVAHVGADRFSITIPKQSPHVEREEFYDRLSMDPSDGRYVENIINGDSPSMLFDDLNSATPAPDDRPAEGTYTLAGGVNGLTGLVGLDFIGGSTSKLGINALNASQQVIDILWPTVFEDLSTSEGITAIQQADTWLAARKHRILYFPSPTPDDIDDAVQFRNGTGAYVHPQWDARHLVCYVNTGQVNLSTGGKKYLNALAQLATVLSFNDTGNGQTTSNVGPNFAPAGNKRAKTSFLLLGVPISFPDPIRDTIENANLNYIADMGKGRVLWNNSTLQVQRSKLQDLNIVRMVMWLAEKSQINLLDLTWDPLDAIFWRDAVRRVDKVVKFLKDNRGLYDYRIFGDQDADTLADITVNTTAGLDAGEYRMEVYLKPTPAAKIIGVDLIVTESSVDFDLLGEFDAFPSV